MDEESGEMHSEDDKTQLEKNKKRIVKTRAQVQALEKFYNEHKYPTESMKLQLAESIGLTEKQVSGWFCHRRLKDKRLLNGENVAGKQDRSSGAVQDRGSGLRQDSCGSTKQGDDRNVDAREVESGRFTVQEYSAAELTYDRGAHYRGNYNHTDDGSSGSSSSLRNMSNHHSGDRFDVASPRYLIPKFPTDVKTVKGRSGPSGYLKVKGHQVENAAITAVKRQLGKHYREDGPPLGVEFDPLPPGAFESSAQDPVDETYYSGEAVRPASPDVPKIRQHPKSSKGREYSSSMASQSSNLERASFKLTPDNSVHQKFRQNTFPPNNGAYYPPRRNSSLELPEGSTRDITGVEGRDDYGMKPRQGFEVMRMGTPSSHHHLKPYGVKVRVERESWFQKHNDFGTKTARGQNIEDEPPNLTKRGYEYPNPLGKGLSGRITKDGNTYTERRIVNENRPFKNDSTAPKRMRDEFTQQQHFKRPSSMVEDRPGSYRSIRSGVDVPSSFSEDEESAETSSSVD